MAGEEKSGEREVREVLRFLVSVEVGSSPDPVISEKCIRVLAEPVTEETCKDFRAVRRRVMCRAWEIMEREEVGLGTAIRTAWAKTKEECLKAGVGIG